MREGLIQVPLGAGQLYEALRQKGGYDEQAGRQGRKFDESSQSASIKRNSNGGHYGGLKFSIKENINEINALIDQLEAGTGIEPVFTDLQSAA